MEGKGRVHVCNMPIALIRLIAVYNQIQVLFVFCMVPYIWRSYPVHDMHMKLPCAPHCGANLGPHFGME